MRYVLKILAASLLAAGLAACDTIGDGNTLKTLEIVPAGIDIEQGVHVGVGTANEFYKMHDCFCSNIAALATFTDGTVSNFSYRVKWTSSNTSVVEVVNDGDAVPALCPFAQFVPGLLIPKGAGDATITAEFSAMRDSFNIKVVDTVASGATFVLESSPVASPIAVAVGNTVELLVKGTFDGRERVLTRNVSSWSLDPADDSKATITQTGLVRGVSPTGTVVGVLPPQARASFASCPVVVSATVNVGEVVSLDVARESPEFAADGQLAVDTDEYLTVTAGLSFDDGATVDGTQVLGFRASITATDTCTLREHDAAVAGTNCRETVTSCSASLPVCSSSTATSCPSDLVPCRTSVAPISSSPTNRIVASSDSGSSSSLVATYPGLRGGVTTLGAAIDASQTTLTVASVAGYPTTFPWYATLDAAGTREDLRVTAADGTLLTVVRGIGGTTPAPHAAGVSFEERFYTSDAAPLVIRSKDGALLDVTIDAPGVLAPLQTLQLQATGTFDDADDADPARQQRVTRLPSVRSGTPATVWFGSDASVAFVNPSTGFVTSNTACGGNISVRARASTSTSSASASFDPASTADDLACAADPLCDQVDLCVARTPVLPDGTTCEDPAPVCP